jgi:hypothetical protein
MSALLRISADGIKYHLAALDGKGFKVDLVEFKLVYRAA